MDKSYADTVRLLLAVAPEVFANEIFAMKGGTAINLFVQDMPRLSVDIDVVYRPWQVPRAEAWTRSTRADRHCPAGHPARLANAHGAQQGVGRHQADRREQHQSGQD